MPRGEWVYDQNTWRALIGSDVGAAPPPRVLTPPSVIYTSPFSAAGTGSHLSKAWPTNHQAGDVAFIFVETANEVASLFTAAGFVEASFSPIGTGTAAGAAATRLTVFWKRATSSAEPNVAVQGGVSGTCDHFDFAMVVVRGCPLTGNPWEGTPASDVAAAATTAVSVPTYTTLSAQCLILEVVANATDSTTGQLSAGPTNGALTGLMTHLNQNTSQSNGGGLTVWSGVKATAGAVGATTGTLATSSVQARLKMALLPSQAVGGGVTGVPLALMNFYQGVSVNNIHRIGTAAFDVSHDTVFETEIIQKIANAKAQGLKMILMMTGGSHSRNWAPGVPNRFDMNVWKSRMDLYNDAAIIAAVQQGVTDGVVLGADVIDEPQHFTWNDGVDSGAIMTKAKIDEMCDYVRAIFGATLPVGVSVKPDWKTSTVYTSTDFVVYQYGLWKGPLSTWIPMATSQAAADHVKIFWNLNLIDGGGASFGAASMTAAQIEDYGTQLLNASPTRGIGLGGWEWQLAYFQQLSVQAAFDNLKALALTVTAPANWFRL